jgi:hypothetical protein
MRPKSPDGWKVATSPYRPSAMTPAPIQIQPRCSRMPRQTSHAPPISNSAAMRKRVAQRGQAPAGLVARQFARQHQLHEDQPNRGALHQRGPQPVGVAALVQEGPVGADQVFLEHGQWWSRVPEVAE